MNILYKCGPRDGGRGKYISWYNTGIEGVGGECFGGAKVLKTKGQWAAWPVRMDSDRSERITLCHLGKVVERVQRDRGLMQLQSIDEDPGAL